MLARQTPVAFLLVASCHLAPPTIQVAPDVSGDHGAIRHTTLEALDFWCEAYGIEDCDRWRLDLTVIITAEPELQEYEGGTWLIHGLYYPYPDYIEVVWYDGPGNNALFHELLHRTLHLEDHEDWATHSNWFAQEFTAVQRMWVEDHE